MELVVLHDIVNDFSGRLRNCTISQYFQIKSIIKSDIEEITSKSTGNQCGASGSCQWEWDISLFIYRIRVQSIGLLDRGLDSMRHAQVIREILSVVKHTELTGVNHYEIYGMVVLVWLVTFFCF